MSDMYSNDPFAGRRAAPQGVPRIIIKQRAPTSADTNVNVGDMWVDTLTSEGYVCTGKSSGVATWTDMTGAVGSTTVVGNVRLATVGESQAGVLDTVANTPAGLAAVAIAGAPNWSESVSGIGQLATTAEAVAVTLDTVAMTPAKIADVFAAPPAIGSGTPADGDFAALGATGLLTVGASATITTGATTLSLGADAGVGAINVGTGAAARAITVGNVTTTTGVAINAGTGHITLTSTSTGDIVLVGGDKITLDAAGTVDINSSAGAINIADDDIDQDVNISTDGERTLTLGSENGAAGVVIQGGTGDITVGNGTIAHSTTVGNQVGASALVLECGTGNFSLDGVATSDYAIGASTTSGTIDIGGTAQTGTMTLGDSSGTNIVQIGSGEGATTVAIAGGATAAKVVTIADGAVANVVTIGTVSGAASLDLLVGTGNMTLEGNVASTYTVSGTGANTGAIVVGAGTGARTASFNVGAAAKTTVIGSTNTTSTTTLNAGSGSIVHVGPCTYTPDAITAASAGVAASVATVVTEITTNGDSDLDNVTLANGVDGQVKIFAVVAVGNASDSVKITPASMIGGTQITFAANPLGLGCQMYYDAGAAGWIVTGNNGGTVA